MSSSATLASRVSDSWRPPARNCTCVLAKSSKTLSPIRPVPGHGVLLRLREIAARRRRRKGLFQVRRRPDVQVQTLRRAVDPGHVLRTAARRKILQVDDVAHVEEVVGPARAAVGRLQPVDAGLPRPVEEHDGVRRSDLLRHHHFDVHRAAHRRFLVWAQFADVLAAGIEEAVTRDVVQERPSGWRPAERRFRGVDCAFAQDGEHQRGQHHRNVRGFIKSPSEYACSVRSVYGSSRGHLPQLQSVTVRCF